MLLAMFASCSKTTLTGGTEDGNATALTGTMHDSTGAPIAGVVMILAPSDYDPRTSGSLMHDTTDSVGKYSFGHVPFGKYNIEGILGARGLRSLHSQITVDADSVVCGADTLLTPGSVSIINPYGSSACQVLVVGTTHLKSFSAGTDTLVVDSLPSGIIPKIEVAKAGTSELTVVGENIVVSSGDTLHITHLAKWNVIGTQVSSYLNDVRMTAISKSGYVWFGADSGLARYDSSGAVVHYDGSSSPVLGDLLQDLLVDDSGTVWAAGHNGLIRFKNGVFTNWIGNIGGLTDTFVYGLGKGDSGKIWASLSSGIVSFDGTSWTSHPVTGVNNLFVGHGDTVWCATVNGVVRLVGIDTTRFTSANSNLPNDFVQGIVGDSAGDIWVATQGGMAHWDRGTNNWIAYTTASVPVLPNNDIYRIALDRNGVVWAVSGRYDIVSFDGSKWTVYTSKNSILPVGAPNIIQGISIDSAGVKWLSVLSVGIIRFED